MAKVAWALVAAAWAVALPANGPWVVLLLLVLAAGTGGVLRPFGQRMAVLSAAIVPAVAAIALAGQAGGEVYGEALGIQLTAGKLLQFSNSLAQVLGIIAAAVLVAATTDLEDLFAALTSIGLPRHVASSVAGALEALPALRQTIDGVREAQIARGVPADGRLLQRAAAFGSILRPVLLATIEEATDREVTLILRGFQLPGSPTELHAKPVTNRDRLLLASGLVALPLALTTWIVTG